MRSKEAVTQAFQILIQISDAALVDGSTGRSRDQAVSIIAEALGIPVQFNNASRPPENISESKAL